MQTKLTLRVNNELIHAAKQYAQRNGISLSQLVENYLQSLVIEQDLPLALTPILQQLTGILPPETSLEEYHRHLEEKYG
jgi:antitoxin component of RelBE/YafQ-DinJ toxin-antitoxin module